METRFNSDDKLPLNKMKEFPTMAIVVRAVFHGNNKSTSFLRRISL